jgi:hypothetical protein
MATRSPGWIGEPALEMETASQLIRNAEIEYLLFILVFEQCCVRLWRGCSLYDDELYSPWPVPSFAEGGESSLSEERGNPGCLVKGFDFALVKKSPPLADARPSQKLGG